MSSQQSKIFFAAAGIFFMPYVFLSSAYAREEALNVNPREVSMAKTARDSSAPSGEDPACAQYLEFFEKIYQTMDENYYQPASRDAYQKFIEKFRAKIFSQLKETGKSDDFVRWRSAAFLVENLKSSEDIFSAFYPPKPAKEYQQTALGVRVDLGIEGEIAAEGFKTSQVEPRSDAYKKGLRIGDIIAAVDGKELKDMDIAQINELLNPLVDSKVQMRYLDAQRQEKIIEVVSKEYFKQTVFMEPTTAGGIYCLKIARFNQKTFDDLLRFLEYFRQHGPIRGLILDLRGNPGGPPLAAREISALFLPAGEEFAYFKRKGEVKSFLDVPQLPERFHYDGPVVILINKESGSSSELFSGILQRRRRAVLMGTNSAGQVMLKSMFHFDDGSMVLLVTARGHHPDGAVFSFNGLTPDRYVDAGEESDILDYATKYLVYVNTKTN